MVDSLIIVQKIFTEFLFIKNVFEIDKNILNSDPQTFELKSEVFYSLDTIMSLKKESQLDVNYSDPLLPLFVKGDLNKFR